MKIEFISERKVVKTMKNVNAAVVFGKELVKARGQNFDTLQEAWDNVGKLLPKVDPFLPLTLKVTTDKLLCGKRDVVRQVIWKNTCG